MKMKLDTGIRHVIGEICTVFCDYPLFPTDHPYIMSAKVLGGWGPKICLRNIGLVPKEDRSGGTIDRPFMLCTLNVM